MVFFLTIIIWIITCPSNPFNAPYSTIVTDSSGKILSAHISNDGQWRFSPPDSVPYKFKQCIINFEDSRFYQHHGVDILAILRAAFYDIKNGKIVSGGSTITMQTVRLWRNESRTFFEKFIEIILAERLEFKLSKDEILTLYAAHAPFGGNTVGLETASIRYFGRNANNLTWAESAMLAVLPNSPSLIHLSKNRDLLKSKRDNLLFKLYNKGVIDSTTYVLSISEPIVSAPKPYPNDAPQLLDRVKNLSSLSTIRTTIDKNSQIKVSNILNEHVSKLHSGSINNGAVLVLDVKTGDVVAYVGNSNQFKDEDNANCVDIITSPRSTGSILKPFLYAAMLTDGQILPNTLVADIPTQISGYMPKNYRLTYDGAVPANRALARSLNVPAVKMLQTYGGEKFIPFLKKLGLKTINKSSDYYGLSLILGGCEATLWDLCGAYASFTRSLFGYVNNNNFYNLNDWRSANLLYSKSILRNKQEPNLVDENFVNAASIWFTLQALTEVERPEEEYGSEMFESNQIVAWKTGTSFGFRDAWAIGVTSKYVVGVWIGNADGEGRPGIVGIHAAAPVLFDVLKELPKSKIDFPKPLDDMTRANVCVKSGYIACDNCEKSEERLIPKSCEDFSSCPYCHLEHFDLSEKYRVTADCENPQNIIHKKCFVLPPAMEYYYRKNNVDYKVLPPMRPDCLKYLGGDNHIPFQIVYPVSNAKIFIPKGIDGNLEKMVVEVSCREVGLVLFWHLDNVFLGETVDIHKFAISAEKGSHVLTIVDKNGNSITRKFEIL
ncbi:MAG: penicillin-binding protein 1C [Bacteroidales bacterium]|nr:penicillin-binding protein 1C [Bacteroidales bacterium]